MALLSLRPGPLGLLFRLFTLPVSSAFFFASDPRRSAFRGGTIEFPDNANDPLNGEGIDLGLAGDDDDDDGPPGLVYREGDPRRNGQVDWQRNDAAPPIDGVFGRGALPDVAAAPEWQPRPPHRSYHRTMCSFMAHVYPTMANTITNETVFDLPAIQQVRPHHVLSFLQIKAYGRTPVDYLNPDHRPTECRSSTLEFAKKAISHYMPGGRMAWNGKCA